VEKENNMATQVVIQDEIILTFAPHVPGLTFRGFKGDADYQKMLDLINASKEVDQIERTDTLEDITRAYEHLNNCDPYRDMIFGEVYGEPIAYGRVEWNISDEDEWLGFVLAFIHPAWRRKGIGTAILRYQENHLRRIAEGQLKNGELSGKYARYFETFTSDTEVGKDALLHRQVYSADRFFFSMVRPFSEPVEITPMPEGLEIRKVEADQFRQVWEADQEAFKDHWGYIPGTEEDYNRWLKDPLIDPDLWRVAWDGDQVAGMVLNFLNQKENEEYNRQRGYTENISVRRSWRRQGLARALFTRSLQMFKEMGMDHASLGVDTQNLSGALNLYQSVGFQVEKRHTMYRKKL
jgi:ribosomal protein S18 acetylase RimI-like enzyme